MKFYDSNPFKLQERIYPIDFGYKKSQLYMLNIDLGNLYQVVEKPEDIILSLPNNKGQIRLSNQIIGNKISLLFKFEFKSSFYEPEYYPYLKKYINKIIDIQNNSLFLLKRKSK